MSRTLSTIKQSHSGESAFIIMMRSAPTLSQDTRDKDGAREKSDCRRPHAFLLVPAKHFWHQINLAPATKTQRRVETRPRETCERVWGSVGVALGDNPSSRNGREINTLALITKPRDRTPHGSPFKQTPHVLQHAQDVRSGLRED